VLVCASCVSENSDAARFCEACAVPLGARSGERRKVVTVLFCDVVGSTALGESTDPEALRALLARYFERMKGIPRLHRLGVSEYGSGPAHGRHVRRATGHGHPPDFVELAGPSKQGLSSSSGSVLGRS
jgi:class 3 adenylate cyclase